MKILCIGDPHLRTKFIDRSKKMISEILRVAQGTHPDLIVILGDILHDHRKIDLEIICLAIEFFKALSLYAPLRVLIGNHDRINNTAFDPEIHPFQGLQNDNIKIISASWSETIDSIVLGYVSYLPPGKFRQAIESLDETPMVIFAHQEVQGCKMGPGIESTHGDLWHPDDPMVISGHIHGYQRVQPNWLYPGTPIQHHFGESPNRGVSVFELFPEDDYEEVGPLKFRETRYPLDVTKLIVLDLTLEELRNLDFSQYDNSEIKLRVSGTQAQFDALPNDFWNQYLEFAYIDKKVIDQAPEKAEPERSQDRFLDILMQKSTKPQRTLLQSLLNNIL